MGCGRKITAATTAIIRATSSHLSTGDSDCDLFTGADLSILEKDEETYNQYAQQVRKEFTIYPDAIYNLGRKTSVTAFPVYDPYL